MRRGFWSPGLPFHRLQESRLRPRTAIIAVLIGSVVLGVATAASLVGRLAR
jgi:hypothetical protein